MKLVRGRAFGLRNTAMICGCPLDRLLATCPFSEAHPYNCLAYILYRPPAKIWVHNIPPYYPWLSCLELKLRVDQAGSGGERSFISLVVPPSNQLQISPSS
ncbi:hypothetical protein Ac2012v2_002290 [Leucoagaricus gongylophorus]